MNIDIEKLENEIKKLEIEKNKLKDLLLNDYNLESTKRMELIRITRELEDKIDIKKNELYKMLISKEPDLSDGIIDLYKTTNDNEINYTIYLSNTEKCIGFLDYRKYDDGVLGNIGYGINPEYRGNHYSLQALNLVSKDIEKDDIDSVVISVKKDNIPSIKIIEKFGGILINTKDDILIYECKIKENKNEKKFN